MLAETARHFHMLLQEVTAIDLQIKAENCGSEDVDDAKLLAAMQLQLRREEIKREVEILENTEVRLVRCLVLMETVNC